VKKEIRQVDGLRIASLQKLRNYHDRKQSKNEGSKNDTTDNLLQSLSSLLSGVAI
jgi:hypothetical protein